MEDKEYENLEAELSAKEDAEMLMESAIRNNFDVLVGKRSIGKTEEEFYFHDPTRYPTSDEIDEMISYFETTEEYENCSYLLQLKQFNEK